MTPAPTVTASSHGQHLPSKPQIADSFSRAAASYDGVAALQRSVGEALLSQLPPLAPRDWLDLGCGTGHFTRVLAQRHPQARGTALDLAPGMVAHARAHGGAQHFVQGDAEALPLAAHSQDLIYSNLVVQWCEQLPAVLAQAQRVLRPGGVLAFSSLCSGTLRELQSSWQQVDDHVHVNRFRHFDDYARQCAASGLQVLSLQQHTVVLHFAELRALTHELKALGAHNLNPGRATGLTGRARLRALVQAYEQHRQSAGLPATYEVVVGVLRAAT